MFLHIGTADPAMQVGGQGGDDVVDGLGHRREWVVGSEDDVAAAEDVDRCMKRVAVVCQTVAPQPPGQATRQVGRVGGHAGDDRAFVESSDHRGQRATAVRQADSHFGSALECTVGDKGRRCQRRLGRHSCGEAQSEAGHPGG
jgi:hypothetical protein